MTYECHEQFLLNNGGKSQGTLALLSSEAFRVLCDNFMDRHCQIWRIRMKAKA